MSLDSVFLNLILEFSAFDRFSKQMKNNTSPKNQTELYLYSSASVFLLILNIRQGIKYSRKCDTLFVISSHGKILNDLYWTFLGKMEQNKQYIK